MGVNGTTLFPPCDARAIAYGPPFFFSIVIAGRQLFSPAMTFFV
jgi:hypothetical protein